MRSDCVTAHALHGKATATRLPDQATRGRRTTPGRGGARGRAFRATGELYRLARWRHAHEAWGTVKAHDVARVIAEVTRWFDPQTRGFKPGERAVEHDLRQRRIRAVGGDTIAVVGGLCSHWFRHVERKCDLEIPAEIERLAIEARTGTARERGEHDRMASGERLGRLLQVTCEERRLLGLSYLKAIDETPEEREAWRRERRRERDRERKRRARAAAGATPRDQSAEAMKPWDAEGISRRTWYRRRAAGGTDPSAVIREEQCERTHLCQQGTDGATFSAAGATTQKKSTAAASRDAASRASNGPRPLCDRPTASHPPAPAAGARRVSVRTMLDAIRRTHRQPQSRPPGSDSPLSESVDGRLRRLGFPAREIEELRRWHRMGVERGEYVATDTDAALGAAADQIATLGLRPLGSHVRRSFRGLSLIENEGAHG